MNKKTILLFCCFALLLLTVTGCYKKETTETRNVIYPSVEIVDPNAGQQTEPTPETNMTQDLDIKTSTS